jgi:hypothetical protein
MHIIYSLKTEKPLAYISDFSAMHVVSSINHEDFQMDASQRLE